MVKAFKIVCVAAIVAALGSVASADNFGTVGNEFTIDFVPISGDASGANGTNISQYSSGESGYRTFTDPGSDYRMGVHEITNDQWNKFKASLGMDVTGFPSTAYDEAPDSAGPDVPVNNTSWYEAAQFVNWLNTFTGHHAAYNFSYEQGTASYSLGIWAAADAAGGTNLYRHKDAFYYLPTEDEWVKAAFWNGTVIQTYANALPGDLVSGDPDPAKWNYDPSTGSALWDVGSGSEELNGTYDMMGNAQEWMEGPYNSGDYGYDDSHPHGWRGGPFNQDVTWLPSSYRSSATQRFESEVGGFRVASIPEPATLSLLALGGLALIKRRRR